MRETVSKIDYYYYNYGYAYDYVYDYVVAVWDDMYKAKDFARGTTADLYMIEYKVEYVGWLHHPRLVGRWIKPSVELECHSDLVIVVVMVELAFEGMTHIRLTYLETW